MVLQKNVSKHDIKPEFADNNDGNNNANKLLSMIINVFLEVYFPPTLFRSSSTFQASHRSKTEVGNIVADRRHVRRHRLAASQKMMVKTDQIISNGKTLLPLWGSF